MNSETKPIIDQSESSVKMTRKPQRLLELSRILEMLSGNLGSRAHRATNPCCKQRIYQKLLTNGWRGNEIKLTLNQRQSPNFSAALRQRTDRTWTFLNFKNEIRWVNTKQSKVQDWRGSVSPWLASSWAERICSQARKSRCSLFQIFVRKWVLASSQRSTIEKSLQMTRC